MSGSSGTHGSRQFFQLKHRLLEYLVSEKGFTAFVIEAGLPPALEGVRQDPGSARAWHLLAVVLARLVPYKRIDLAVEAFNRLGLPLVVIGPLPSLRVTLVPGPPTAFAVISPVTSM